MENTANKDGKSCIVTCVKHESIGEEISNAISHGIGGLLAIAGTALLIIKAAMYGTAMSIVCASLYGASMITLYTISTLYHALTAPRGKKVFQILDHCSVFLLILGTYIPISLVLIGGALGWTLFGIIAACAVVGIVFNSISLLKLYKISLVLYIVMGWLVVLAVRPVINSVDLMGIILLVGGGVAYTAGVVLYKRKREYSHFVWHLFVLAGSIMHFFFVFNYCYK
jgi:hemolysin III